MDPYRVLRPFDGERRYAAGEIVDATGWRWTRQLVERRYLAPAPPAGSTTADQERRGPGRPRREEG